MRAMIPWRKLAQSCVCYKVALNEHQPNTNGSVPMHQGSQPADTLTIRTFPERQGHPNVSIRSPQHVVPPSSSPSDSSTELLNKSCLNFLAVSIPSASSILL